MKATYHYKVTLTRMDGQRVDLIAHGLETIASNLDAFDPRVLGPKTSIPGGTRRGVGRGIQQGQLADQSG
jgi:hypothetical protein